MKAWFKRVWCVMTGGHELVEHRETRYVTVWGDVDGASARVPIDIVSKSCTRCG